MSRDRDVRNAIQAALNATGLFDNVYLWGLPEVYGSGVDSTAVAAIDPMNSTQDDRWDAEPTGGLLVTSRVNITILCRNADAQLRDEAAERLLDAAANALNGKGLASLTLPGMTKFASWTWMRPTPPERRISSVFTYTYIVEGWDNYDVTQ